MSIIVKLCKKTEFLAMFTSINHYKHDTIFQLKKIKSITRPSTYVGLNQYSFDNFGLFMRHSTQPTCKIIEFDVVALNNIDPGTELTYDQALHEEKEKKKKKENNNNEDLYNERED